MMTPMPIPASEALCLVRQRDAHRRLDCEDPTLDSSSYWLETLSHAQREALREHDQDIEARLDELRRAA